MLMDNIDAKQLFYFFQINKTAISAFVLIDSSILLRSQPSPIRLLDVNQKKKIIKKSFDKTVRHNNKTRSNYSKVRTNDKH